MSNLAAQAATLNPSAGLRPGEVARLQVRVGLPAYGGALSFNAFEHDYPVMVSAAAFWQAKTARFRVPEHCNLHELDWALDSAGFTAVRNWQRNGTQAGMFGIYPWTLRDYVELAALTRPTWWAQPDLCCEPAVAGHSSTVIDRQDRTAAMLEAALVLVERWRDQMLRQGWQEKLARQELRAPVPVLQGWDATDYERSLDLMLDVMERFGHLYDDGCPALIGIGSVCRRELGHRTHGLYAVLAALKERWPAGSRAHLFGVKGTALARVAREPWIHSTDSMAYDDTQRRAAHKSGVPNSVAARARQMTAWASAASRSIAASDAQRSLL